MSQTACAMESVREEAQPEQKMWARHQGSTPRLTCPVFSPIAKLAVGRPENEKPRSL